MVCLRRVFSLAILLASLVQAQTAIPTLSATKEGTTEGFPTQEAAIVEEMTTVITYANDGNFVREQKSRVRVLTDAGVQVWGVLSLPFQSATQVLDVDYVRVHKPDGSIVETPPDNIQDLDSEITRSAPFYSDLREKHVAVKGLAKGDLLEYQAHWHTTKSLIPGQFWIEYNFIKNSVVQKESLEVKVPIDRAVKVKGPQDKQAITTEAGYRCYTWINSQTVSTKESGSEEEKETETNRGRLPPNDIQVSSFQSWEEVGRWYWNLQKDRIEPSPAIHAKAAELTSGLTTDGAKLRALYGYVSTHYRYIGIAFGIGRYQPHAADDVLANNYGDCKDKQTLLASLVQAAGFSLYPALINTRQLLDPDVPSPAQFDHVIGYLPLGKDIVWLDTTPEVAPFGLLLQPLRDKQALVMSSEKSIQLISTPADPPFPSSQHFQVKGKLNDDGTLEAKINDTIRGDAEVVIRGAFRRIPQPQWKDLVQQISYGLGFAGVVSDVDAHAPEAVSDPFQFSYSYNRKDYPDWTNRQFTVPGLPFYLPPLRDNATYPVWLGSPAEQISESRVEIPSKYQVVVPPNADLKYDFAEYHASYSLDQGALVTTRRILIKQHEIPVSEFNAYRDFFKNMHNDLDRYVQTSSAQNPRSNSAPLLSLSVFQHLSSSESADANHFEADARDAITQRDPQAAISSLYRAVAADPKFARAWLLLGVLLTAQHQYPDAVAAYETAVKNNGDRSDLEASLGMVYLKMDDRKKAEVAFQKLATLPGNEIFLNDVAYEMANADLNLPLALDYAHKAVRAAEEKSQKISLEQLSLQNVKSIFQLAAYWDTLGWVQERMSQLDEAELYLRASWRLTQDGVVAGHLCHLYKRIHKDELAAQMCSAAIQRMSMSQQLSQSRYSVELAAAQKNLDSLKAMIPKPKIPDAADLIVREREFKLPHFMPGTQSAEFFVLFNANGKDKNFSVEDVKFVSGSNKMLAEAKRLKAIEFKVPAPSDVPTRFVRRGIFGCYQYSGCSFVLLDPASVNSVN